jgi:hypothetical protein
LHWLIINIGYALLFLNLVLYLKVFFKQGKAFKIFTVYLLGTVLVQITSKIFMILYDNNLFLSHFYFIGQFVLLSLFFKSLFKTKTQKTIVNWFLIIGILVLALQYLINPSIFFKFNLFEIFVTSFLIIIMAAIHLYNLLSEEKVFYYCTLGILLYLSGSTILFFVGNLTAILSTEYQFLPWTLNGVLVVIYHCFILFEWRKTFYLKKIKINNENKPTL